MNRTKVGFREVVNRLKTIIISYRYEIIGSCLIILICILHALSAGHYANFYPINGTFQNYNPVRRMLSGQIPYKEFNDYLGLGHLYLGTLCTFIFGGDYQGSLIAFSFLTFGGLSAIALMVGKSIFKSGKVTIYMTIMVELLLIIQPLFFVNALGLTEYIISALNYALGTGNSARFVRGLILPICVDLMYICDFAYNKHIFKANSRIKKWIPSIGAGIIAGFGFIWSNDYGISCWLCICIFIFWLSLSRNRKIIQAFLDLVVVFCTSVMSIFVFVEVFTLGHFTLWLKTTFGTGRYQSWYYNSSKSYYLYDVDFSYIMLIQAGIAIVCMGMVFLNHGSREAIKRYGIIGFANMACFCAVNEYKLLSGGSSREVALAVLFLTVLFEIVHMIGRLCNNRYFVRNFIVCILVVSVAWCTSTLKDEAIFYLITDKDGEWVESMGGYMTYLANDLNETSRFLAGENFWSTYASAQEVVEDKFQPSGTDYIIHVLGDDARDNYLNEFSSGDFKYVATMRKDYTDWEYWVERANWFFYRELYRNWHPVFSNSYEIYWERNAIEDEYTLNGEYDIQIQIIGESAVKLIIQTDEYINGIADVYIDYSVDKKDSRLAKLLFQRMLKVENTDTITASEAWYESTYLRDDSAEYVPMTITNGYGELTLTAMPERSTILNLIEVRCDAIYVAGNAIQLASITDENWSAGVSTSGTKLLFNYSDSLLENLNNAEYIQANGETFKIVNIENDDPWIRVDVDKNASVCAFPVIITMGGADIE